MILATKLHTGVIFKEGGTYFRTLASNRLGIRAGVEKYQIKSSSKALHGVRTGQRRQISHYCGNIATTINQFSDDSGEMKYPVPCSYLDPIRFKCSELNLPCAEPFIPSGQRSLIPNFLRCLSSGLC